MAIWWARVHVSQSCSMCQNGTQMDREPQPPELSCERMKEVHRLPKQDCAVDDPQPPERDGEQTDAREPCGWFPSTDTFKLSVCMYATIFLRKT